jgi:glycosyltransferase involved in cell wall biosynthesis
MNRADTIVVAVNSVLAQSFADLEVIVVDDGSTDGTPEIVKAIQDSRLRVIVHPENRGVSAARNTGIKAALAPWIAFQDSDDEWLPAKLERQMARIAQQGPHCVGGYCGMIIVGSAALGGEGPATERYHPGPEFDPREGDILQSLLRDSLISTQTLVARRDLLLEIGGFDEALPALVDWDCVLRLARRGPFAFVDEPLVRQYFSQNSITRSRKKRIIARERVVTKNLDILKQHPILLAQHYRSIAGEMRRVGDMAGARSLMARALRIRPLDPGLWVRLAYLSLAPRR